jgi:hypothetical protein
VCAALGKRIAFGSIDLCYQNHESGGGKSPPCSSAPDWSAGITVRVLSARGLFLLAAWLAPVPGYTLLGESRGRAPRTGLGTRNALGTGHRQATRACSRRNVDLKATHSPRWHISSLDVMRPSGLFPCSLPGRIGSFTLYA